MPSRGKKKEIKSSWKLLWPYFTVLPSFYCMKYWKSVCTISNCIRTPLKTFSKICIHFLLHFVGIHEISLFAVRFISAKHKSTVFINMSITLLSKHLWKDEGRPKCLKPHIKPVIPQGCIDIWEAGQADSSVTDSQQAQHNKTQNISWERQCSGFMMTLYQTRLDQGAVLQGIPSTNSTLNFHICMPHHTNFWNYSKETCNMKPLSCT